MNILITGASSGIGRSIAHDLSQRGHRVFGTSRRPDDSPNGIEMVPLEVTDDASVAHCVAHVLQRAGAIDVLINNAGYHLYGAAEETSVDELDDQMQTNFYGAVRMIQAVLPGMRAQRAGKIVNIGSIGGFIALPYTSAYSASKFALEGYSEALRYELLPLGIYVALIEPTGVKTGTQQASIRAVAAHSPVFGVGRAAAHRDFLAYIDRTGVAMDEVAAAVRRVIEQPQPALRHHVGTSRLVVGKALMPQGMWESVMRRQFPVAVANHTAEA
jgi:short-subunit dehydrogenase